MQVGIERGGKVVIVRTLQITLAGLLLLAAGCRKAKPAAGDLTGSLLSGGVERTYVYRLPTSLDPAQKPWPMVLALHGRLGTGAQQEQLTHFSTLADKEGFIVVYPDGVEKSWADGRPGSPAQEKGIDDVAFLSALIDEFVNNQGADKTRVFVAGMSNGAMMSYRLACDLSDKVAAIGPVAGLMYTGIVDTCKPKRPVPVMIFAGTEDPLMPYEGGPVGSDTGGEVLSAVKTLETWAKLNGCQGEPTQSTPTDADPNDGTTLTLSTASGCSAGAEVKLFTVNEGGHTWPGGNQYLPEGFIGKTSRDVDASQTLWEFFKAHPMQ
ncbi:MAG: esterase [Polyangiaceae bacterium]|nr:esterase [Polyangiaceae bacterium]